jgi:hypothetical protein
MREAGAPVVVKIRSFPTFLRSFSPLPGLLLTSSKYQQVEELPMEPWEQQWNDYYKTLRLHPDAEPEIVRCTYLRLAQLFHPDKDSSPGADKRFSLINEAFETLSDPDRRARYHSAFKARSPGYGVRQHGDVAPQTDERRDLFRQAEQRREEFRKQRQAEYQQSLELRTTDPRALLFVIGLVFSFAAAVLVALSDLPEFLFVAPLLVPTCAFWFKNG